MIQQKLSYSSKGNYYKKIVKMVICRNTLALHEQGC